MPSRILRSFFDEMKVKYEVIRHPKSMTALETAEAEHEFPEHFAKVVVVKAGGSDKMFVIPANRKLDLFKAADACGDEKVRVEYEFEIRSLFPDSDVGAMPPFGPLYEMPCFVDARLIEQKDLVFNAGTHTESFKIKTSDYVELVKPQIGDYTEARTKATTRAF